MGKIADRVRQMRGCSLADIVAEIERMEAGGTPDLFGALLPIDDGGKGFETWWAQWPDKVNKKEARVAYGAARKKWPADDLLAFSQRYVETKPPGRPWMHASTFLRGERWKDQPAAVQQAYGAGLAQVGVELMQEIADEQRFERAQGASHQASRQLSIHR